MSNANSVADVILRQNNGQPIVIAATTTLHQAFSIGTSPAALTLPTPLALYDAAAPFPGRAAVAIPFIMRAAGTVVGGERYVIDINLGLGLTNTIATTGLAPGGLPNDNWLLEVEAMWDPNSSFLRGIFYGWAGPMQVSQGSLAQVVQPANLAALTFNCAVTIATANANASFSLTEFSAEIV